MDINFRDFVFTYTLLFVIWQLDIKILVHSLSNFFFGFHDIHLRMAFDTPTLNPQTTFFLNIEIRLKFSIAKYSHYIANKLQNVYFSNIVNIYGQANENYVTLFREYLISKFTKLILQVCYSQPSDNTYRSSS